MILKNVFFIVCLHCLICFSYAQGDGRKLSAVPLGSKVPDFTLKNVINYSSKTAKFSDFKGKLLILDFWSTQCSSCIASWPHLLEMQKEFGDKIQIVLVNPYQDEKIVRSTFERRKKLANVNMTLPAVCFDSAILKLFPVSGVPHVVWIDKEGVLTSVTYSSSVNSKNISDILQGKDVKMTQKIDNDDLISPDFDKPLFITENGGAVKKIYSYSVFAKGDDRLFPTYGVESRIETRKNYIVLTNHPIINFYRLAYSRKMTNIGVEMLMNNRIVLRSKDSLKYVASVGGEIRRENLFVYQYMAPSMSPIQLQERLMQDLNTNVGLNVRWEKKKMKCLVLKSEDTTFVRYKGGVDRLFVANSKIAINNVTVGVFIDMLESNTAYGMSPYPIVDETKFVGRLGGVEIESDISDYGSFDKALRKYKMRLVLEYREVDVLVLEDPVMPFDSPLFNAY